jgi:hypothetical protein
MNDTTIKGETIVYGTASTVENIETKPTIQFKTILGEDLLCTSELIHQEISI